MSISLTLVYKNQNSKIFSTIFSKKKAFKPTSFKIVSIKRVFDNIFRNLVKVFNFFHFRIFTHKKLEICKQKFDFFPN